jgi:hypothetical protein
VLKFLTEAFSVFRTGFLPKSTPDFGALSERGAEDYSTPLMTRAELPNHDGSIVRIKKDGRPTIVMLHAKEGQEPYLVDVPTKQSLCGPHMTYDFSLNNEQIASLQLLDPGLLDSTISLTGFPVYFSKDGLLL